MEPIIKLKKDNLEISYYEDVPITEFFRGINISYSNDDNNEEMLGEMTISYTKRNLIKNGVISEFIDFIEYPYSYRGIAYKTYDPKYPHLANILYIYKTDDNYYIQYQYPISFEDKILIAEAFIDTAIKNYDIELKDMLEIDNDENFCYGLALTTDENQIRYDYSGGKLKNNQDFILITNIEDLTEETLETFNIGEEKDKCQTYIVRTDDINYIYFKNLDTNIEYIYEEIEYEVNNGTFYRYVFLSKCENNKIYDENNQVIDTNNNLYNLYIKEYIDKIEEFENNYLKPCGVIKGFPDIDKELFTLDNEINSDNLSFKNKKLTPGSLIRTLKRN